MSRLSRGLARLATFGYRNSRWHLVVALVFAINAPLLLAGLRIDADAAKLIPGSDPIGVAYRESRTAFGESNPLALELRHEELSAARLDGLADELAATLESWDDIRYAETKAFDLEDHDALAWRLRAALRNTEPSQLAEFHRRLAPEGMRRQLLRTRKRLVALDEPRLRAQLAEDPLGIASHLAAFERHRVAGWEGRRRSTYFEGLDGRSRLLWVQPLGSAEDTAYCRQLVERIRTVVREAARATGMPPGLEHRLSGAHVMTAESAEVLFVDLARITLVATASLFALLWLAFGRLRATLLCFLPLLVSQLAVLGIARLLFNPINPLTIGFAAVVIGLGLDIGLHMTARLARFLESSPLEPALRSTFAEAGPPIVVGASSTALAFLALVATGNRGLVQFGVLSASGLLLALVTTLLLFPALARHLLDSGSGSRDLALRQLPVPLLGFVSTRPRASMAIGLALVAIALPYTTRFRFDTEVAGLFPAGLEAVQVARELGASHGVEPGAMTLLTIQAPDLASAMAVQRDVDRRLEGLVAEGAVSSFESPSRYLPYTSDGSAEVAWRSTKERVEGARDTFFSLLDELGFRVEPAHHRYYDLLETATEPAPVWIAPDRDASDGPPLDRFVHATSDAVLLQSYVVVATDDDVPFGFDVATTRRVTGELGSLPPPSDGSLGVSGLVQVYERAQERLLGGFARVSWVALLLVAGVSLLFFRRVAPTLLTFLPLAAVLPTTLAVTVWLDVAVMPFAISFGTIVVGVGIDDAVHILARTESSPGSTVSQALQEIGPVITLTSLSTILGFGALALSRLTVVASLGVVVGIGVAAAWVFSLLLLPAAIHRARRGRVGAIVAGCLVLAIGSPATHAQADRAGEILDGMEKAFESVEAVSCDIDLVKSVEQLTAPIRLHGTLTMQRPASLRLELSGDEALSLMSDGATTWLVDHDLDEVESFPPDRRDGRAQRLFRLVPSVVFLGREEIEERFAISSLAPGVGRHRLELVPKLPRDASFIRLVLDLSRNYRVKRMYTEYANADSVTTELSRCRRSKRAPPSAFRYEGQ